MNVVFAPLPKGGFLAHERFLDQVVSQAVKTQLSALGTKYTTSIILWAYCDPKSVMRKRKPALYRSASNDF